MPISKTIHWFLIVPIMFSGAQAQVNPYDDKDDVLHVPAVALPPSSLLSNETHRALAKAREQRILASAEPSCGDLMKATPDQARSIRTCEIDKFQRSPLHARLHALYSVDMTSQSIGGVYAQVFLPQAGIATENRRRVLINLHGGGYVGGSRTASIVESIPIAATGRIKVISIDYRQGPEHEFPAASEDVEAVYRELLKSHKPKQIGIYGCSAGGLLTAQTIAWLIHKKLPLPGAAGMFCEGAASWMDGDSRQFYPLWKSQIHPYFKSVSRSDPFVFPINSTDFLSKFPPSLLISATRDGALSSILNTHSRLVALGIEADLHVWEGLGHGFHGDPDLPESREVYDVVVKFFKKHLAT